MANGSFGLSGLPSAPTTVSGSSSIVTPFTQTEVTLASVNGFSAGDLVYQYNGDYQPINSTAASSATFPVDTQKVTSYGAGASGFQQVLSNRFSKARKSVATLSNGNIVWTYLKWGTGSTFYPYFVITDENNNVVVAETLIEAVSAPNTQLGPSVVALSGGGFVIAWVNASNNIRYGVYTSTGTVTTALQTDTGVTVYSGGYELDLAARPVTGGFVFAILESSTNIVKHRVYGPTGTATYAWTSNNTQAANYYPRVAVRSDDSFVIISMNNSTNLYIYYLWTSTNGATTNSSFSAVPTGQFCQDVCTLSSDVFIFVAGTSTGLVYRTLTGTTLSGTSIRINPGTTQGPGSFVSARQLTSGGWAVVYTNSSLDTANQFYANLVYVNVYNSSNTLVSVTYKGSVSTYTGYAYNYIPGSNNPNTYLGFTETANYIHVTTDGYSSASRTMQWSRLNKTTYLPVPFTSAALSPINTSALSTAAYAPSASNPTSASFYAASTSAVSWSTSDPTSATINAASTLVDTNMYRIDYTDSAPLSNGGAVLVYSGYQNTPSPSVYYVKYIIFGPTGAQLGSPVILNSGAGSFGLVRVQGLSNGKFVLYTNSTLYVFSNTGTQLASLAISYTIDANHPMTMAALSGGRFALVANATSALSYNLQLVVYDDSLNVLSGPTTVASGNLYPSSVTTLNNNIYVFNTTSAGTINRVSEYVETSTNTWSATGTNTLSQSGYPCAAKASSFNNGSLLFNYWDGTSNAYAYQSNVDGSFYAAMSVAGMTSLAGTMNASQFNAAITSNGNVVLVASQTATAATMMEFRYQFAGVNGGNVAITILGNYPSDGARQAIAALTGERIMLGYVYRDPTYARDSMGVAIFNVGKFQGTQPITAGSSISNPAIALSPATGFRLTGVATSTAPAGGTGTVVINGNATLNSNYPSIASPGQSFDFSGPVAFGAAGSVIGRNVTLQGNV